MCDQARLCVTSRPTCGLKSAYPDIAERDLVTSRLANRNTVICNWISGNTKPKDWPKTVQVLEVTPSKKVVWAFRSWDNLDLGPASSIQLLDQPGKPEDGVLQR